MKRSTVNLICAVLWALAIVAWLPRFSAVRPGWPRIILPILCAAVFLIQMVLYFINRKKEREE